ncbi:MAG TPA: serine/threonine-protein kinase [Kofleriaceae bacterium]|nr:serine/threonine-protein kinase [Kofleriaceae bacterium]
MAGPADDERCPSETVVAQFAGALLDGAARLDFERHMDGCRRCRQLVGALARGTGREREPELDLRGALVSPGTLIGRYLVLELVGRGAMGAVYAAFDPSLDRRVALKLLRLDAFGATSRDRLMREAKALARISHPNVVTVHDVGSDDDWVFIAMELVAGQSLAAWCRDGKRSAREITSMFVQAGRGLHAAHRAGIVHRDFKPDNVLVDGDGRARVTDFGLARGLAEPSAAIAAAGGDARAVTTSKASGFVGTPAFMSPEQLEGALADQRSDQFSFCVSLYLALYQQRPFAGDTIAELAAAIRAGKLAKARSGRVAAAIERGLAADPAARFPSMDALLARLQSGKARGWIAVPALAVAVGAFAFVGRSSAAPEPCTGAADQLAGAWDGGARGQVAQAFVATHLPYAADTYARVASRLDDYAGRWVQSHEQACVATRVRHDQTEQAMQLRISCLDARASELRSLVKLFAAADASTVQHAVRAASELVGPEHCDDPARVVPIDPATNNLLAEGKALLAIGAKSRALQALTDAVAAAKRSGDPASQAKALLALAGAQLELHHAQDGEASLHEAVLAAERGHDDEVRADAAVRLVDVALELHPEAVDDAIRQAEALLVRVPSNYLEAGLATNRGAVALQHGKFDEALAQFETARDRYTRELGGNAIEVIHVLVDISSAYMEKGDGKDAVEAGWRAVHVSENALGPDHPETATTLHEVSGALLFLDKLDEARKVALRVQKIDGASLGEHSREYADALADLSLIEAASKHYELAADYAVRARDIYHEQHDSEGSVRILAALAHLQLELHRTADAERTARDAIAIADADPSNKPLVSLALDQAAYTLLRADKADEALPYATRALAITEELYGPDSSWTIETLRTSGAVLVMTGHKRDGVAQLQRALKLLEHDPDPEVLADVRSYLARAK